MACLLTRMDSRTILAMRNKGNGAKQGSENDCEEENGIKAGYDIEAGTEAKYYQNG